MKVGVGDKKKLNFFFFFFFFFERNKEHKALKISYFTLLVSDTPSLPQVRHSFLRFPSLTHSIHTH